MNTNTNGEPFFSEPGDASEDRLQQLEGQVESLTQLVSGLESRLGFLESIASAVPASPTQPKPVLAIQPAIDHVTEGGAFAKVIPVVGRTFLILAGALFLRTITESGIWPTIVGVLLGLVYGVGWILLADRSCAKGLALNALFYGVAASMIVYPLLGEATTKMAVFSAGVSAALIVAVTALGLWIACRREMYALSWILTVAALFTCTGLIYATGEIHSLTVPILLLGIGTLWIAYVKGWYGPRWVAAFFINLWVLLAVDLEGGAHALSGRFSGISVSGTWFLALGLAIFYLSSFGLNTLVRRKSVGVFEIVQSIMVLLIGFGGAFRLAPITQFGELPLGIACLVLTCVNYAIAFVFINRKSGRCRNFFFYAWLGLSLVIVGAPHVVGAGVVSFIWLVLAVSAALLGGRYDRITLRIHCAVYCVAAAWYVGFFPVIGRGWIASEVELLSGPHIGVLVFIASCYVCLLITQTSREVQWDKRVPRAIILVLLALGLGALIITAVAKLFPVETVRSAIAVIRTAVLAFAAIIFAVLGRRERFKEMSWFVYPILVVGGLKLLLEDISRGQTLNIFLGFTFYGIALLIAPRLLRKRNDAQLQQPAPQPETTA